MQANSYDLKLAKALKLARARAGLSQGEMARRVGVTFQQIQKYENGRNRVVFSRFIQLCEALETSPDAMLADALRDDRVELGDHENVGDREAFRLYRLAHHVPSKTRKAVLDLMRAVSRHSDDEA